MPWNLVKQESSQSCCYQLVECESGVQEDHRSLLVDWLVEVVDVFDISLRTLFLGVAYMDWYLRTSRSHRKQFQLIGATCLHIASKVEDVSYIGVDDLALCLGRIYEPKDILKMEETVLNNLQFQMVGAEHECVCYYCIADWKGFSSTKSLPPPPPPNCRLSPPP